MQVEFPTIAIVGATGAVGREALVLLANRGHPRDRVFAIASQRSVGTTLPYGRGESLDTLPLDMDFLVEVELIILAVSSEMAREIAPQLIRQGCLVVDNSSAFRLDSKVPLVVPDVNSASLSPRTPLVSNPNCSTILLLVALEPLRRIFGVERVIVSTYQAASGAGLTAMRELEEQTQTILNGHAPEPEVFPEPCAFNVFPHESPIDPTSGLNEEECKLIRETARIWGQAEVRIVPTCARVPVMRSHCQSITVTLQKAARLGEVRATLEGAPGLELLDDPHQRDFPTSLRAAQRNPVLVGRIRPAPDKPLDAEGCTNTFCFWLAGDQLRKGAALNALQIGDQLLQMNTR